MTRTSMNEGTMRKKKRRSHSQVEAESAALKSDALSGDDLVGNVGGAGGVGIALGLAVVAQGDADALDGTKAELLEASLEVLLRGLEGNTTDEDVGCGEEGNVENVV
jgi:hypothetical protein